MAIVRKHSVHCLAMVLLAAAFPLVAGNKVQIAEEGTLGTRWDVADGATLEVAGYPETRLDSGANVCIAMGYRVGTNGRPSGLVVLDQWNSMSGHRDVDARFMDAFEKSVRAAVAGWRFQPVAGMDAEPTSTVTTFGFMGNDAMSKAAVRSHCRVEDLAAAESRVSSRRSRDLAARTLIDSNDASRAGRIDASNALARANGR